MAKGREKQARSIRESGSSRFGIKRSSQKNKRDPMIIVSFILMFALIAGLVAYQKRFHGNSVANYYANLAHNVRLRYVEVSQSVASKKTVPQSAEYEVQPNVQFEFYTALANAKMPEPMENETATETKKILTVKKPTANVVVSPPKVITEKNIEKDLGSDYISLGRDINR